MTHEITITRVIDAPRDRVFAAWTDPKSVSEWWGPQGFTTTTESIDIRPGGVWRFVMHGPDGTDYPNLITFEEIVSPERITYAQSEDESKPHDFHTTVTFDNLDGQTRITMQIVFVSAEVLRAALDFGAYQGAHSTVDKLAEFVGDGNPLVITRIFDAPVAAVWRAWTDPEQVMRWWGPEHFTAPVAKIDFRVGGKYLFAMRDPEGNDYWSTGVYQEIAPMERIVYTDSFSDAEGNIIPPGVYGMGDDFPETTLVTVTFEDLGGRTRMTLNHAGMPRDEMFEMARSGWGTSLDKMAKALE